LTVVVVVVVVGGWRELVWRYVGLSGVIQRYPSFFYKTKLISVYSFLPYGVSELIRYFSKWEKISVRFVISPKIYLSQTIITRER